MIYQEISQDCSEQSALPNNYKMKQSQVGKKAIQESLFSSDSQSYDKHHSLKIERSVLNYSTSELTGGQSYVKVRYSEDDCIEEQDYFRGALGAEGPENSDSTCASPDSNRLRLNQLNHFNSQSKTTQFSLYKLLNNEGSSFSAEDLEGKVDPSPEESGTPIETVKINSELTQSRKIANPQLHLTIKNTKARLSTSSLEGIASPFIFESRDRLSGKTDATYHSLHTSQDRINQKIYQSLAFQTQKLDEVLEEEGITSQNGVFDNSQTDFFYPSDESKQLDLNSNRRFPRQILELSKNQSLRFQPISSRNAHQSCSQLQESLTSPNQGEPFASNRYDIIQEKIFKYFDSEGIFTQAVGEAIHEKNCSAFKGMGKLSPLKLDLTRSPLKRNRANTIQL